jgi:tetratricopeptide (TPR) repeat protein
MHRHTATILLHPGDPRGDRVRAMPPADPAPQAEVQPQADARPRRGGLQLSEIRGGPGARVTNGDAMEALGELLRLDPREHVYRQGVDFCGAAGRWKRPATSPAKASPSTPPRASWPWPWPTPSTRAPPRRRIATMSDYLGATPRNWTAYKGHGPHPPGRGAVRPGPGKPAGHPARRARRLHPYYRPRPARDGHERQARELLREAVAKDPFFVEAWAELAYSSSSTATTWRPKRSTPACWKTGETGSDGHLRVISLNLKLNQPDRALEIYRQGPTDAAYALDAAALFMDEKFLRGRPGRCWCPCPNARRARPHSGSPWPCWPMRATTTRAGPSATWSASPTPTATSIRPPVPHPSAHGQGRRERALELILELGRRYTDQSQYPSAGSELAPAKTNPAQALECSTGPRPNGRATRNCLLARRDHWTSSGRLDEALAEMERIIALDSETPTP